MRTPARPAVLALALTCALLAACVDGADTAAPSTRGGPPGDGQGAPTDGGISGDADDGLLATPQEAALAYLTRVAAQEYGPACQVLAPAILQAIARAGKDCQIVIASEYTDAALKNFAAAKIDTAKINVQGDVAGIPADAFSSPGVPYETEVNYGNGKTYDVIPFFDMNATRLGGSWYLIID